MLQQLKKRKENSGRIDRLDFREIKMQRAKTGISHIKYDKRDNKIGLVIASICTALSLLSLTVTLSSIADHLGTVMGTISVLGGFYFFPYIAIASWYLYLDSLFYLKRLKRYGYEIPNVKKQYKCGLVDLERVECDTPKPDSWSKESVILSAIALLVALGFLGNTIAYWIKITVFWHGALYLLYDSLLLLGVVICWLIGSFYYWRQRKRVKYKDDVELDPNRKTRVHLMKGLVTIIVCLVVSLVFVDLVEDFSELSYRSRVEAGWYN